MQQTPLLKIHTLGVIQGKYAVVIHCTGTTCLCMCDAYCCL